MMRLKFIGTSNANPRPDRRESGILLTIDENHYLFDCGDGIASALWNDPSVCLNNIHAVFFTHRHPDHLGGFPTLVLLMHQRIKKSQGIQPGAGIERYIPPKPKDNNECGFFIPGDAENAQFFTELLDRMGAAEFELAFTRKVYSFQGRSIIYHDTYIQVESFPTYHSIDSAGFILLIGNKRILYSGDISDPKVVADIVGNEFYDVLIIENAHFPPSKIRDALVGRKINQMVITHQKDQYIADREMVKKELGRLMEQQKIVFADDGMELDL